MHVLVLFAVLLGSSPSPTPAASVPEQTEAAPTPSAADAIDKQPAKEEAAVAEPARYTSHKRRVAKAASGANGGAEEKAPTEASSAAVAPAVADAKAKRPEPKPAERMDANKVRALAVARQFEEALLQDDPRAAMTRSALPFTLESKRFDKPEELLAEWIRQLHGRRVDLLTLYGIEVLTPAELEQKFGKAPVRLANFPHGGHLLYAVANVSGHGAVLALSELREGEWSVVGYTD